MNRERVFRGCRVPCDTRLPVPVGGDSVQFCVQILLFAVVLPRLYPYLAYCVAWLGFELDIKVITLLLFFVTLFFFHTALHFQEPPVLCVAAVHLLSLLHSIQWINNQNIFTHFIDGLPGLAIDTAALTILNKCLGQDSFN